MFFRQLFERQSSTYTYLFADPQTREAVLLDPVVETVDRDMAVLQEVELTLAYTLDTHIHADHITSACRLRNLTGSKWPIRPSTISGAPMWASPRTSRCA